ncbi:hypothetical protein CIL05_13905 [Virgibacillus profundi]|uniref:Uncharacterized protein n=1 Tax=Virgibacillus profundi TaxID=2024555 RepID=A0A2A2ICS0_9BACI|nr:hypothetical protein [Virgibacillus profundi]PAV29064.1 hypothetical protein CIL05_13905 [Virgibacillus profundi]PXY53233.1 hypothetical protein CIT14_14030 [Virgibacillus profundi]
MNKGLFISLSVIILGFSIFFILGINTAPAITYFPDDEDSSFTSANSNLELFLPKGNDSYQLAWTTDSRSDKEMYLRQDASLLFDNGRLRGVRSKWVQDTDHIQIEEKLVSEDSSFFQVISFHHGEIHYPNEQIKSIRQMSADHLYVIDSPNTSLDAFKTPENEFESEWKNLLNRTTKQQLLYHWNRLFTYFDISGESYLSVPLTSLHKYNNEPLPTMTRDETNKIMGQLWEGLYKNYIIPAVNTENNQLQSYIPIILFDKQNQHLLVLFELNAKKYKLIQQYAN